MLLWDGWDQVGLAMPGLGQALVGLWRCQAKSPFSFLWPAGGWVGNPGDGPGGEMGMPGRFLTSAAPPLPMGAMAEQRAGCCC